MGFVRGGDYGLDQIDRFCKLVQIYCLNIYFTVTIGRVLYNDINQDTSFSGICEMI